MLNERNVVLHRGAYKPTATTAEAVFMITGMTIGAGILGIPYVVAQVGLVVGILYILGLGAVMLCLNLMIGEVAVRAGERLQLPGLAGIYIGPWAKNILSVIIIFGGLGTLLAYIVGEGNTLSALLGGNALYWGVVFWSVGSLLIVSGLERIKVVEKIVSCVVIALIVGLSFYLLPHSSSHNFNYFNPSALFLPYGVILFALHASPAVAEAHALLPREDKKFRYALIIGTIIPIVVYVIFAVAVVGAQGLVVTPVATIGLGQKYGPIILMLANLFAILAMSTGFIGLGTALKETLQWDHKLSPWLATFLVIATPLLLFLAGVRSFVAILEVVGGLFISLEALCMVVVYWQARKKAAELTPEHWPRFWLLALPVLLIFVPATIVSVVKIIIYKF